MTHAERKRAMTAMFERSILRDAQSAVFLEYGRRVHGVERFQYNSLSASHLEHLLDALDLSPADRFLDLGCAVGSMTVEVARRTAARGVGIDLAPGLIEHAQQTAPGDVDVSFEQGDFDDLRFPHESFDAVMAIDTLYFARDLTKTLRDALALLRPGGAFVAFYSVFQRPGESADVLTPEGTPLAAALRAARVTFRAIDLSADDRELWRRAVAVAAELREAWVAAGELEAWQERQQEFAEIVPQVEAGRSARFMYTAQPGRR